MRKPILTIAAMASLAAPTAAQAHASWSKPNRVTTITQRATADPYRGCQKINHFRKLALNANKFRETGRLTAFHAEMISWS